MQRQSHLLTLPATPYFCMPESVGLYRAWGEHTVSREADTLNNFNIHYVSKGKGYVEQDGVRYALGPGDAFIYFPLQQQRYYSSKDEPWDIHWFHFYGEGLHDYLIKRELHVSRIWSIRQPELWVQAHEELLAEAEHNRMLRPHRLSTLTYALLTLFVERAVPAASVKSASSGARITELLPIMQQEATEPFLLERWAELADVTPHYFCKLFRQVMEMTPVEFITRCRLQTAKQWLLERRSLAIGEIAREAGYPSVSYFNRRFLEHEGITPTAYRQLYKGSTPAP